MKLTLNTERLTLRPFTANDAEDMFNGWTNDPEVTKYLTWNTHTSVEETRFILDIWIKEYDDPKRYNFAIELKDTKQLIGGIDVVGYEDGVPVIGYVLSRRYWNKGYMTEACRCVTDFLFENGYPEVMISANVDNIGSNRVIRKCGGEFIREDEMYLPMKDITVKANFYIFGKH